MNVFSGQGRGGTASQPLLDFGGVPGGEFFDLAQIVGDLEKSGVGRGSIAEAFEAIDGFAGITRASVFHKLAGIGCEEKAAHGIDHQPDISLRDSWALAGSSPDAGLQGNLDDDALVIGPRNSAGQALSFDSFSPVRGIDLVRRRQRRLAFFAFGFGAGVFISSVFRSKDFGSIKDSDIAPPAG